MNLVSIVGARPNFVKLSVIDDLLRKKGFVHRIIHTGQHYDYELSRIFFEQLNIPEPDYYLAVGSGSHGYQVGEIVKRVEEVLLKEKPSLVLVYGDTNSTLGGALAAVKAGIRVAHVEAGLRSFDLEMPEEVNRRIVDHISHLLFAPTLSAYANLIRENVPGKVYLTGDAHVDVLARWARVAEERSQILEKLGVGSGEYMVVTVHRAENTDDPARLERIAKLLMSLGRQVPVVFPVHPRTRSRLASLGLLKALEASVVLTEPLGYLDFIKLIKHSRLVVTDSGGAQREAYLLQVPAVVLRDRTEWVELVEAGWVKLLPPSLATADEVLSFRAREYVSGLLGDGRAAERIVKIIEGEAWKNAS
ncbi:MAG: UDP-N-acetylglucosamine 2-epimerase (non-hydrolyzing) [Infirmifilum sp.]